LLGGNHFAFPYSLYDTTFPSAKISDNGNIQFVSGNNSFTNVCLPTNTLDFAILPYWDDLTTYPHPACPPEAEGGCGVFTSVSGSAPNRIFNIEWRGASFDEGTPINFEVRLYEGQTRFDIIYGVGTNFTHWATVGVQRDTGSRYTQYVCNTAGPAPGVMLAFSLSLCATATPTNTPTATNTPCSGGQYQLATATAIVVPGIIDIGNHCNDCVVPITLPFAYTLYDVPSSTVNISSNGNIQFQSSDSSPVNTCLPTTNFDFAILPYWDDLSTAATGSGVYTSVSGTAPNRVFIIEWRARRIVSGSFVNFEVRLYEGQTRFEIVYGEGVDLVPANTVGVQRDTGSRYTQFVCNNVGPAPGLLLIYTLVSLPPCPTFTPTSTFTPTPTFTSTPTPTMEPQPPLFTNSYYINQYEPDQLKSLGCAARARGETGVAILHFGSPRILPGNLYGTKVLNFERYLNMDQIKALTTNFVLGYADPLTQCGIPILGSARDLTVVAGVSNSARIPSGSTVQYQDNEHLTRQHGQAWAGMINELYKDVFVQEELIPDMRIAAGYDSEYYGHPSADCRDNLGRRGPCVTPTPGPPFNAAANPWTVWHVQNATDVGTRDWAEGYDFVQGQTENLSLFNYGSCESCPRGRNPSQWNDTEIEVLLRVSQMTWMMGSVVPFPQIYHIPIPYEWYNVRWFAQVQGNTYITVRGALTGCQRASQCTPIPNPTRIIPRFDEACHFNPDPDPDCDQFPWTDYNCGTCPFLPPSVGWQALSDMLSSPNSPEGTPNPDVTPQPSLPNGVSDIIDQ
jgi:hypothetical protein